MGTAETVKNKPVILQTTLQAVSCQRFTGKPPFTGLNLLGTLISSNRISWRRSPQIAPSPGCPSTAGQEGDGAARRCGAIPGYPGRFPPPGPEPGHGTVAGGCHVPPAIYSSRLVFGYAGSRREPGKELKRGKKQRQKRSWPSLCRALGSTGLAAPAKVPVESLKRGGDVGFLIASAAGSGQ